MLAAPGSIDLRAGALGRPVPVPSRHGLVHREASLMDVAPEVAITKWSELHRPWASKELEIAYASLL
jgi:hypothetical protein